jgi:hypothetical protein
MANKTDRAFQAFRTFFHKAASESAEIRLSEDSYPELEDMAASANRMIAERKRNEERSGKAKLATGRSLKPSRTFISKRS